MLFEERPDVVHTHQSKAGIVGRAAARCTGALLVHTVHMASFGRAYGWRSALFLAAERLSARGTDLMVTVGKELQDTYLRAGVGRAGSYIIVRSPVGVERCRETRLLTSAERTALRRETGLAEKVPVLVTVGALEARKRHELLLRKLQPVIAGGHAVLLVAGDGPERQRLEQRCHELRIAAGVRFLGHVPNVEQVYALADVYVHAATAEGVPQVVIQALASGLPVVATQSEGLQEVEAAPVVVVGSDGADLLEAVEAMLASPPDPVSFDHLEPWTIRDVDRQIARLHAAITQRSHDVCRS